MIKRKKVPHAVTTRAVSARGAPQTRNGRGKKKRNMRARASNTPYRKRKGDPFRIYKPGDSN